jgi:uncharacterized protein (TIGR02231 family)
LFLWNLLLPASYWQNKYLLIMKKNLIIILLLFASLSSQAQYNPKKASASIKNVTVFLTQAQINATVNINIDNGNTEIEIEKLPADIDPNSIQVQGKGDFIIKSVKKRTNFLTPLTKTKELTLLEDSLNYYTIRQQVLQSEQDVLQKEEQMLMSNQVIKGEQATLTVEQLKTMANFYRARLTEIRSLTLQSKLNLDKNHKRITETQNQLAVLQQRANVPSSSVFLSISSKSDQNIQLGLDYIVNNAGWYPVYDLRAKDINSPIQIITKAQVYQNTGIEWNNVKLKLSTNNPSVGGDRPIITTQWIDFYVQQVYKNYKAKKASSSAGYYNESMPASMGNADMKALEQNETTANYTAVVDAPVSTEYMINIPYSIPSDGIGQLVDVQVQDLPATYRYYSTPKLDKDAFLVAEIANWTDLNLMPGDANVYFDGTFVGNTFIDTKASQDTLLLSLGRDKKVIIDRTVKKDYTTKKLIGLNKKEEYAYEISVRNTKKDAIEITIEDQYPVSKNGEIEVVLIDGNGAAVDKDKGTLTWKLKLAPGESKKILFKFSVKYPKGKVLTGM